MQTFFLILLFAGMLYLLGQVSSLERQLDRLRRELARLREADANTPTDTPDRPRARATRSAPAGDSKPEAAEPVPPATPASRTPISRPAHRPSADGHPASPPPPNALDTLWGWIKGYFTGGNVIVRVGIIVLFFGVAFLLQYAAGNNLLPVELRLAGVGAGALALLAVGWRLRERRRGYALAMQGGGIGVLYLTLFAALRLYQLIPAGWVFIFLLAMVGLSAALAVMQNARSLAVLAISGGFLAPVLTSTGQGSHIALFGFYAALNAGILAIAWFKAWRLLNVLGFVFTFVIGTAWGVTGYRSAHFAGSEAFLILFFLFYVAIPILFARRQPPQLKGYVDGTLVFGVPLVAFALQTALVEPFDYGLAWSALALGGFYITTATLCWRLGGANYRLLSEAFLALGVVFASLTIPFALDGEWLATAWALEGAALVWVSLRQRRRLGTAFALLLQLGAGLGFLISAHGRHADWAVLNSVFIGAALVALAGLFSSYYVHRHHAGRDDWERFAVIPLLVWGLGWWFGNGLIEIAVYAPQWLNWLFSLLFIALSAAALGELEWRLRWTPLRHTVTGLGAAMLFLSAAAVFVLEHALTEYGYLGWPIMFGVFYALLYRRDRRPAGPEQTDYLRAPLHALGLWLAAWLLTDTLVWLAREPLGLGGGWQAAAGLAAVLALMVAAMYARTWPWMTHRLDYLTWGLTPPAVYVIVWSLFISAPSAGETTPLPYLPLINPLDLVQAAGLLVLLDAWWRLKQHGRRLFPDTAGWSALGALAFVWLNAVLLRTLHHWAGAGYNLHDWLQSNLVQACVSVFWTLLGLTVMILAARAGRREPWMAAAGLLGVVVAKLFLFDLQERNTPEAIASFIVVGILLLVVGYFSPLPPKRPEQDLTTTKG